MSADSWEELLRQVGPAHHEAFAATDGEDPDWSGWYAVWLHERIPSGMKINASELAELLRVAAETHTASGDDEEWPVSYARFLSERLTDQS
jgi:hypothetical protein